MLDLKKNNRTMADMSKPSSALSFAAALLGRVKSKKKAEAARRNGKLSKGRPKKIQLP